MKCEKCGFNIYSGTTCPMCEHENSKTNMEPPSNGVDETPRVEQIEYVYPMKWYKVLLVLLWFGIVGNLYSAYTYFSGDIYQSFTGQVYAMLPSMETLNIVYGVFSILMVVFTFVVWLTLKNYKKNAPKLLVSMYVANVIFTIAYTIAFYIIIGSAETTTIYGSTYTSGFMTYQRVLELDELAFSESDVVPIIIGIVMTVVNYIYFKNRKDMFIN